MQAKPVKSPQIESKSKILEESLLSNPRSITVGDAAAITALNTDDAKRTLDLLLETYFCKLKVNERGDLIYDFGKNLMRRGEKTFAESWADFWSAVWKFLTVFYKIGISIIFLAYFVIFFVFVVVAAIVLIAKALDDDSGDSLGDFFGGVFKIFGEIFYHIFFWNQNTVQFETVKAIDRDGYQYRKYETPESTWSKFGKKDVQTKANPDGGGVVQGGETKSKSFIVSIYDFALGPERVQFTHDDQLKEIAAFVRKEKGIVTQYEILGLSGASKDKSAELFTESLSVFGGEAKISENGVLYGEFDTLLGAEDKSQDAEVVWFWDEYEPPYEVTGNSAWRNFGLLMMNGFNFVVSFFLIFYLAEEGYSWVWTVLLGWFPMFYSVTFVIFPVIRAFYVPFKNAQRKRNNLRKRVMKAIFMSGKEVVSLSELENSVNSLRTTEQKLEAKEIEEVMRELREDLDAETEVSGKGEVVYRFFRFKYETEEAKKVRQNRLDFGKSGIVFEA